NRQSPPDRKSPQVRQGRLPITRLTRRHLGPRWALCPPVPAGANLRSRLSQIEESMSAKKAFPAALVFTALSLCAARGQTPPGGGYGYPGSSTPASTAIQREVSPEGGLPPTPGPLSSTVPASQPQYITYPRPAGCCGPIGGDGPIQTELYLRSGIAFNLNSTGNLAHALQHGWVIDVGARSLFIDADRTAAWAVSYGVSNVNNHGNRSDIQFPLQVLVPDPNPNNLPSQVNFGKNGVPGVTVQSFNRTFLNLGVRR